MSKISFYKIDIFHILVAFLMIGSSVISFYSYKGGVWDGHVIDGNLFMSGGVPDLVAYPMWGYSLLAGLFGELIVVLQSVILFIFLSYWYGEIVKVGMDNAPFLLTNSGKCLLVLLVLPFVFLGVSYYSNSMAYVFSMFGVLMLSHAVEEGKSNLYYAFSGILLGFGYNFRSEVLIIAVIVLTLYIIYSVIHNGKSRIIFVRSLVFVVGFVVLMIPWLFYTKAYTGKFEVTSTNGPAVMYIGLGYLNNNPWNIKPYDNFARAIAKDNGISSQWSSEAKELFAEKYKDAVLAHPVAFVERIFLGIKLMMTQGLYIPNIRSLVAGNDPIETKKIDYLNERLKKYLGLYFNEREFNHYLKIGIVDSDIEFRHKFVIFFEYFVRMLYALIAIIFIAFPVYLIASKRFGHFVHYLYGAHLLFISLVAGLVQSFPRHTTIIVPIAILSLVKSYRYSRV